MSNPALSYHDARLTSHHHVLRCFVFYLADDAAVAATDPPVLECLKTIGIKINQSSV